MKRHTVEDVMTRDVVSVRESTGYKDIVEILAGHALSAVPVVDDRERVVGVVSEADLLHKIEFSGLEPQTRLLERTRVRTARAKAEADNARDLMTAPAVVIGPREAVAMAAKLMDAERVKRLPVVEVDGRLVGIVSRVDLLRLYLRDDSDIRREVTEEVLRRTLWLDPDELSVTVDKGVVTIGGTVDRRSTIGLVVHLVHSVEGVVEVVDHLTYHHDDISHPGGYDSVPIGG
jgi:CBS domain-containing protein